MSKVTMYDSQGRISGLPEINVGRFDHGCGHYVDNNNEIVGLVLLLLLLMFVLRSTWSLVEMILLSSKFLQYMSGNIIDGPWAFVV